MGFVIGPKFSPSVASNVLPFQIYRFGGTDTAPPPVKPPGSCGLGHYCVKAVCQIEDETGRRVGRVTGHDTRGDIDKRVEHACAVQRKRGQKCSEAEVTLLPHRPDLQCSGQIVFCLDGNAPRLLNR